MEQLHYCLGLPRTCSTLLMRILSENPRIFASNTCPTPYFVEACQRVTNIGPEFMSMDRDLLNKTYNSFLYNGLKGWFEALTDKPVVFSKAKTWAYQFPLTFSLDSNSKYLVLVRDLRDIICSYNSQTWKHAYLQENHQDNFEQRVATMTDPEGEKLGRWLFRLPHILETKENHPEKFMFIRQEDFTEHPTEHLKDIYSFIGEDYFKHDLNNIPDAAYYEHDAVYRQPISHKIRPKLENIQPRWPDLLTKQQSDHILTKFEWYYRLFYPEVLQDSVEAGKTNLLNGE